MYSIALLKDGDRMPITSVSVEHIIRAFGIEEAHRLLAEIEEFEEEAKKLPDLDPWEEFKRIKEFEKSWRSSD